MVQVGGVAEHTQKREEATHQRRATKSQVHVRSGDETVEESLQCRKVDPEAIADRVAGAEVIASEPVEAVHDQKPDGARREEDYGASELLAPSLRRFRREHPQQELVASPD